ncbi:hypothetical protein DFH27DRAFT_8646 [Peziza echinospora]|nr:hypothetical protein DFH27DRAFT_8646 [Peziza echinospora]
MTQGVEEIQPQKAELESGTPDMFVFTTSSPHEVFNFTFPSPATTPASQSSSSRPFVCAPICRKRARPLADIDGQSREITKKRRLRLTFVTSRLSAPFASPRNNVDRGNSKSALWARQRAVPTHQFRKMAILNRIKRETMAMKEAQQRQIEIARQQHIEKLMAAAPRRTSKRLQSKKQQRQQQLQLQAAQIYYNKQLQLQAQQQHQQQPKQEQPQKLSINFRPSYRKIAPVAVKNQNNITPMHRRPPTPPSEEELDRQRKLRKRK